MDFKAQISDLEAFKGSLSSMTDSGFKRLSKLSQNDFVEIKTWKERDVLMLRKYFALIKCTIYHLPESFDVEFSNIDNLRKYLMILIGEYYMIPSLKGGYIPQAKSIAFQNMDEEEFKRIYNATLDCILKHFLKDIDQVDFELDILRFIEHKKT
jgi:hypothetical protein